MDYNIADVATSIKKGTMKKFKSRIKKGLSYIRAITSVDAVVYTIVVASLGALISSVFSKVCKKLVLTFTLICTVGSAYLIYKSFFTDKKTDKS